MVKANMQYCSSFTCNNFILEILLTQELSLSSKTSKMSLLIPPTSELESVLMQLFSEHPIKQIPWIFSAKMKTPVLFEEIFLTCNPRSSCLSKQERADAAMWERATSSLGMRREDQQELLKHTSMPKALHATRHRSPPGSHLVEFFRWVWNSQKPHSALSVYCFKQTESGQSLHKEKYCTERNQGPLFKSPMYFYIKHNKL